MLSHTSTVFETSVWSLLTNCENKSYCGLLIGKEGGCLSAFCTAVGYWGFSLVNGQKRLDPMPCLRFPMGVLFLNGYITLYFAH